MALISAYFIGVFFAPNGYISRKTPQISLIEGNGPDMKEKREVSVQVNKRDCTRQLRFVIHRVCVTLIKVNKYNL